jgi:eukaryotic-like serine/threonine-protein kinase
LSTADPRLGTVVAGRYRLHEVLGHGGAGIVYSAQHVLIGRDVAVKVLRTSEEDAIERFLKEARATVMLSHPNVVEVLDMGETGDGAVYLAMELLFGKPLSRLLKDRTRLDVDETVAMLLPVMAAVAVAHDRGMIHRDLKPANIMLAEVSDQIVPKLLDFGLVKEVGMIGKGLTQTGMTIGTPHYMAPEQVEARPDLTPAVDVWAMSVIWYRCLTGQVPFDGPNPIAILGAVAKGQCRPIDELADVPADLAMAISKGMRLDPEARPATMTELLVPFLKIGARLGIKIDQAALPMGLDPSPAPAITSAEPATVKTPVIESKPAKRGHGPLIAAAIGVAGLAGTAAYLLFMPVPAPLDDGTTTALLLPSDAGLVDTGETPDTGIVDSGVPADSGAIDSGMIADATIVDATINDATVNDASSASVIALVPAPPPPVEEPVTAPTSKRRVAKEHFEAATQLRQRGKLHEAIASLDRAIDAAPDFTAAYNSRGLSKQDLGNLPGAIADFDKALELEPTNAPILNNRGTAKHTAGDTKGALADFGRAVEAAPDNVVYLRQRANTRMSIEDWKGGLEDWNRAIELDGGNSKSRYGRAIALQRLGDDEKAIVDLDAVIDAEPQNTGAWFARGMSHLRKNHDADARRDFEKVLALDPQSKYKATVQKHLGTLRP